jgi:hypothetical protein
MSNPLTSCFAPDSGIAEAPVATKPLPATKKKAGMKTGLFRVDPIPISSA